MSEPNSNKTESASTLGRLINSALIATISVTLVLVFIALLAYDQFAFRQKLEDNLSILAKVSADNSQAALSFEDEFAAQNTLRALSASKNILYAAIINEKNQLFTDYHFNNDTSQLPDSFSNGIETNQYFMSINVPVIWKNTIIGSLYLKADMQELDQRRNRFLLIGLAILFIAVLLSFILSTRLVNKIIQPILNLGYLASRISKENNYSLKADKSTVKEINTLVFGFNHMLNEIHQHQTKLISSEQQLSLALLGGGEGTWNWDVTKEEITFDSYSCRILGLAQDKLTLSQNEWLGWISEDDISAFINYSKLFFSQNLTDFNIEYRIKNKYEIIWLHVQGKLVKRPNTENKVHVIGVIRNISKQKKSQEQIKLLATVFDNTSDAIVILDTSFSVVAVNKSFSRITSYVLEDLIGTHDLLLCDAKNTDNFREELKQIVRKKGHWKGEAWGLRKPNTPYPIQLEMNSVSSDQKVTHYVAVFSDITLRKRNEDELFFMANYDQLTSLPNRGMFHNTLNKSLVNAKRNRETLAVLFIDLDKFKQVNDTLGHSAGDELLKQSAKRFVKNIREADSVYRLSGDEFTIILESLKNEMNAENVAKKIRQDFQQDFLLNDHRIKIGISIGISIYPNDATESEELLKHADTAMYFSKSRGRNNYSFFNHQMNNQANRKNRLEIELQKALAKNEIQLYYQAKVDAKSFKITGFEALARWVNPELGTISPTEFIPIAEESGLITALGQHIFATACAQLKVWHQLGYTQLNMAINVSAREFQLSDYPLDIARILNRIQVDPTCIELELTESLVMDDPEKIILMLEVLKNLNVSLSIDDFGTGYSSLSYLRRFPIDILKVDQSFIRELELNKDGLAITAAIISMAHNLGLKVVAEGVETLSQLKILQDFNCELIQGYLFSHPLTAIEAEALLTSKTIFPKNHYL